MNQYAAVSSTGIYCRPGCGAKPLPRNVTLYELAAAAEADGYRACLRCRPYRTSEPGVWLTAPEIVCRGVRLILGGALDSGSESSLANRLGVSGRHLRRLFQEHLGVTPGQLARSSRTHFARRLLDDTDLSVIEIAVAAGFGSVRQLNRDIRQIFRASPRELRSRRRKADRLAADGGLLLRLPAQRPLEWDVTLRYFSDQAIPGVESVSDGIYRRTISIEGYGGVLELLPGDSGQVMLRAHLPRWGSLLHLVHQARSIFGLDSNHDGAIEHLRKDPVIGPLIERYPDLRVPGTWDPFETGVSIIMSRGAHSAEWRRGARRLVELFGEPIAGLEPMGLTHLFPDAPRLADADLSTLGVAPGKQKAINAFAQAVVESRTRLDGSASLEVLLFSLLRIPGMDSWTANQIALRMGEPDAFPYRDDILQRVYDGLSPGAAIELAAHSWSPWRALAATYLWAAFLDETPLAQTG